MATPGEILFFEEDLQPIIFYQSGDGSDLPRLVFQAIKKAEREGTLQEPPLFARCLFQEMVRFAGQDASVSLMRYQCSHTIEVYASWNEDPEFIVDDEDYTYRQFMQKFSGQKNSA